MICKTFHIYYILHLDGWMWCNVYAYRSVFEEKVSNRGETHANQIHVEINKKSFGFVSDCRLVFFFFASFSCVILDSFFLSNVE